MRLVDQEKEKPAETKKIASRVSLANTKNKN
jgi:hypothetical protein